MSDRSWYGSGDAAPPGQPPAGDRWYGQSAPPQNRTAQNRKSWSSYLFSDGSSTPEPKPRQPEYKPGYTGIQPHVQPAVKLKKTPSQEALRQADVLHGIYMAEREEAHESEGKKAAEEAAKRRRAREAQILRGQQKRAEEFALQQQQQGTK